MWKSADGGRSGLLGEVEATREEVLEVSPVILTEEDAGGREEEQDKEKRAEEEEKGKEKEEGRKVVKRGTDKLGLLRILVRKE